MKKIVHAKDVSIRDLSLEDIPHILAYWYMSPPGEIKKMGADLKKMPTEIEMRLSLEKKLEKNRQLVSSKLNILSIYFRERFVGFHSLYPLVEGVSGIFHAHLVHAENRGLGIAKLSYPLACRLFVERFRLEKIVFKTPVQNIAAIKVKESLGIPFIDYERISFGIIKEGTQAKVFEWDRESIEKT